MLGFSLYSNDGVISTIKQGEIDINLKNVNNKCKSCIYYMRYSTSGLSIKSEKYNIMKFNLKVWKYKHIN